MRKLESRIRDLERRKSIQRQTCHVLYAAPGQPPPQVEGGGRYMLVVHFGTDSEWERAALIQQRELTLASKYG